MYEKSVRAAAARGIDLDETDNDDNPWTFLGSLYYAYTVVTSIGTYTLTQPNCNFCSLILFGRYFRLWQCLSDFGIG